MIPKYIIFRLRITYHARLRNLATGDLNKANIELNTDVDMVLINKDGTNETISFDDVNFIKKCRYSYSRRKLFDIQRIFFS